MGTTKSVQSVWRDAFDGSTHAVLTVDYPHHELHEGNMYSAGTVTDLASGGTVHLMITAPDTTKWVHLLGGVNVEAESTIKWYENPTSPTGGGTITPRNHNRNSSNTSSAVVVGTVGNLTGTAGDVLLYQSAVGSGRFEGGSEREANEWILKQNEQYILEIVNNSTGNSLTSANFVWYEHTDKE